MIRTENTRRKTCNMMHVGRWHEQICKFCATQEKPLFERNFSVKKDRAGKNDRGKKRTNFSKDRQDPFFIDSGSNYFNITGRPPNVRSRSAAQIRRYKAARGLSLRSRNRLLGLVSFGLRIIHQDGTATLFFGVSATVLR
ncbi:hypothetical protein ACS0TY_014443 [Phlomoides rotata]